MKIYTGRGDDGTAGLISGERIPKNHERIEAVGAVDELNTTIGVLRSNLPAQAHLLDASLAAIQSELFHLGSTVATWRDIPLPEKIRQIRENQVARLEADIDRLDGTLPPLEAFVLPSGSPAAAAAHFARTVCRRAERRVVGLSVEIRVGKPPKQLRHAVIYLNRLSDYLFVVARHCNHIAGVKEEFRT